MEKGFSHSEQHPVYPFTSIKVGGLTDEDKATNKEYLQVGYRIQTINPTTDTGFRQVRGRYDGPQGFRFELNSNPNGYNIKPFETRPHKYDYSATAEPLSDPKEERKRIKAQRSFRLRSERNQQKRAKAFVNLTLICRRKEDEEGKLVTAHRVKTAKCDSGFVSHAINIGESVRCNYNCTEPQQQLQQQQLQQRKRKYEQTDIDDDDEDSDVNYKSTPSLEQRRRVKNLRSIKWRENDFKQRNTPTTFKVFVQFDTSVKPAAVPTAAATLVTSSSAAATAAEKNQPAPAAAAVVEKKQPVATTIPAAEKNQQPTPAVATATAAVAATKTVSTATTTTTATRAPQTGSSAQGAVAPTPKSEQTLATFVTIKPGDNQVIVKPDQRIDKNIYMIVWSTPNNNRPQAA